MKSYVKVQKISVINCNNFHKARVPGESLIKYVKPYLSVFFVTFLCIGFGFIKEVNFECLRSAQVLNSRLGLTLSSATNCNCRSSISSYGLYVDI